MLPRGTAKTQRERLRRMMPTDGNNNDGTVAVLRFGKTRNKRLKNGRTGGLWHGP